MSLEVLDGGRSETYALVGRDESQSCSDCAVRRWAICGALNVSELGIFERFKSGDRIVRAGTEFITEDEPADEFYTVLEGWTMLYQWLADGERQVLDFALQGTLIGFETQPGAPNRISAQALTNSRLCVLPRAGLIELLRAHPELAIRLAGISRTREITLAQHLANVGQRRARARIANLLMELIVRVRATSDPKLRGSIQLPVSQEIIGDALGLTSVHVNRMLRELREDGIVAIKNGTLKVLDAAKLADEADLDLRHLTSPVAVN